MKSQFSYRLTAPDRVTADIQLPASKSISNRLLIIRALSDRLFAIDNLSDSDDTQVLLEGLSAKEGTIDIGAAGTSMRFLTALFAVTPGQRLLTGSQRMQNRPIGILVEALRTLGASIEYLGREGFPPLRISGQALQGQLLEIDGSVSSQYITALLLIAPTLQNGLILKLKGHIASRPYIAQTLSLMQHFGVETLWIGDTISVRPGHYEARPFAVEGDWSSASYWYEIAAFAPASEIAVSGLQKDSLQGDAALVNLFARLGVDTQWTRDGVRLLNTGRVVSRFEYNFENQPDLAQTFAVTAAMLGIPFHFSGLSTLKIKETDRIAALKTELARFGVLLSEPAEGELASNGSLPATFAAHIAIDTYEDHRMAMAFAPAVLKCRHLVINAPEVVSKSYPQFWEHLRQSGFGIEE